MSSTAIITGTFTLNQEFGTSSRKGKKPQASIGRGCLYDVMNRMVLESNCRRCKFNEMRLAEEQIDHVYETIGGSQPFLVVMDRGYPSTAAFIRMMEKGILFLAHLKSSIIKKGRPLCQLRIHGWTSVLIKHGSGIIRERISVVGWKNSDILPCG